MEEEKVKELIKEAKERGIEFCVAMTNMDTHIIFSAKRVGLIDIGLVVNESLLPTIVPFNAIEDIGAVISFDKLN